MEIDECSVFRFIEETRITSIAQLQFCNLHYINLG
jgi:hypothetical protein